MSLSLRAMTNGRGSIGLMVVHGHTFKQPRVLPNGMIQSTDTPVSYHNAGVTMDNQKHPSHNAYKTGCRCNLCKEFMHNYRKK
jgi:hypothetical protein